jgi:hypothetical protein
VIRNRAEFLRKSAIYGRSRGSYIMESGAIYAMFDDRNCQVDSCGGTAVAALAQQDFCLTHFVSRCYGQLDRVDPRGRKTPSEDYDLAQMRAFVEECSQQTLDVCLRSSKLTNLERAQLLDILLWAGELFLLLRAPRLSFSDSLGAADGYSLARSASQPQ